MDITKNTTVCISIAARPGKFGSTIFNAGFQALGLDFVYKPLKVEEKDLADAVANIRDSGIRGCGVSMPHKINILSYLDEIDPIAKKIGAINTVVNDQGILKGYNTDFLGAQRAIKENYDVAGKRVLLIGAGGVSRAIIMALKENKAGEIYLTNRDQAKGQRVAKEFDIGYYSYIKKSSFSGDLLINATPVGMTPNDQEMIIDPKQLQSFKAVMDVVVYPHQTKLLKAAEDLKLAIIPGWQMALYQATAQFKLYTGQEAPLEVMKEQLIKFLSEQNK